MKLLSTTTLIFSFVLILNHQAKAQQDSLSRYFDDKEISTSKSRNILKTDLISIIRGDVGLQYERGLSDEFSVTIGAGVLMPYYVHDLLAVVIGKGAPDNFNSTGFSYQFHGRWYPSKLPDGPHYGILHRTRNFADVKTSEFALFLGNQKLPHKRFIYDWYFGIGIKTQTSKDGETYLYDKDFDFTPVVLLGLQFGTLL